MHIKDTGIGADGRVVAVFELAGTGGRNIRIPEIALKELAAGGAIRESHTADVAAAVVAGANAVEFKPNP